MCANRKVKQGKKMTLTRLTAVVVHNPTSRILTKVNRTAGKIEVMKETRRGTRSLGMLPITNALDAMDIVYANNALHADVLARDK